ncbi:MAG: hypothetical protein QM621_04115 [Aeromicrobium sp.]|uniref:hypothetical protein n=1 Tax=Aeromicrobium sp. TaxID=1871063 RepID=UPI0039E5AEE6
MNDEPTPVAGRDGDQVTPMFRPYQDNGGGPRDPADQPTGLAPDLVQRPGREPKVGTLLRGGDGNTFKLVQSLAEDHKGGFGALWIAVVVSGRLFDPTRRDQVAVKFLMHKNNRGERFYLRPTPEDHDRVRSEYERSLGRGDYVVRGLDYSRPGDEWAFVVMRYVPGTTLARQVQSSASASPVPLGLTEAVCSWRRSRRR